MLSLQEALDHAAHALHDTVLADGMSYLGLVNEAGIFFYGCRAWNFAQKQVLPATIGPSQTDFDLPYGVAEVLGITSADATAWKTFTRVESNDLAEVRARYAASGGESSHIWYTLVSALRGDQVQTEAPRMQLALAPAQSAAMPVLISYRATWPEMLNEDASKTVLPIPDFARTFFLAVLRKLAQGYELDGVADVDVRLAGFMGWPSYQVAVNADGRLAPRFGPNTNTAIDEARRGRAGEITYSNIRYTL